MTATSTPTPNMPTLDVSSVIERQEANLHRQLEWVRAVDGKIPIVIGLATAMLAVTGALSPSPKDLGWAIALVMALGSFPLVGCLSFCAAATFPHTDGPDSSLIYFGGICKLTPSTYRSKVSAQSDLEYLADLSAQCHRNAQIASAKYRSVRLAMLWLFVATPAWLIACYILYKA